MAVEIALPTLGTVLATALIDSINPCAIGVMILLISTLIALRKKRSQMLKIGLIYISAVYLTYFAFGLGLIAFLAQIPLAIAMYISLAVALLVIFMGLTEIKDFFWYGKGFSLAISPKRASQIHKYVTRITVPGVIFLGAFVAAVELPCTGGPYLAITILLSQNFNLGALVLLIIYNVIFVMPLVVILALTLLGINISRIKRWKQEKRAYMRYMAGLLMIALGWLLMLIANGIINLN